MATGPRPNSPKPGSETSPRIEVKSMPVSAGPRPAGFEKKVTEAPTYLFGKENYYIMFAGLALILIGFFLLSGGKSANVHEFKYDEIYSVRRITIAPIVLLLGFGLEIYAIMKRPKTSSVVG